MESETKLVKANALHLRRLLILSMFAASLFRISSIEAQTDVLATLRPNHPRLLMLDSDLPAIRTSMQNDAFTKQNFEELRANGDQILALPVEQYFKDGPDHSFLTMAQYVGKRIYTLAALYRLTGDTRYADRAKKEMLAVAAFPNWNPSHFLDTGEMTAAMGIGYDWLYGTLSVADRATIRTAIVNKGIQPWLVDIRAGGKVSHMANNWVQVCTGGITLGALAVADEEPGLAREAIEDSRPLMINIMKLFAPDGGFEEGPKYWVYATTYNVLYLAALDSALGTDFGLSEAPGFSKTGEYRMQSLGPFWCSANVGDAYEDVPLASGMFWMATRFHHPEYTVQEEKFSRAIDTMCGGHPHEKNERFLIFGILWHKTEPPAEQVQLPQPPLMESFERVSQAFLRSSWDDPNAWYVAFKGGSTEAPHGHLDLGSFILDAFGQRWAMDLGLDDYALPGYFHTDGQRWTYYRTRTEAHNTLEIDDENEDLHADAPLVLEQKNGDDEAAVLDLGQAYQGKLESWQRGVALLDGRRVLVQDEVVPASSVTIDWHFHTMAKIEIAASGQEAALTLNGARLEARIVSPSQAHFEVRSARQHPPQADNAGVSDLVIPFAQVNTPQTISVIFSAAGERMPLPEALPLAVWDKR